MRRPSCLGAAAGTNAGGGPSPSLPAPARSRKICAAELRTGTHRVRAVRARGKRTGRGLRAGKPPARGRRGKEGGALTL